MPCQEVSYKTNIFTGDNEVLGVYEAFRVSQDYEYLFNSKENDNFKMRYLKWAENVIRNKPVGLNSSSSNSNYDIDYITRMSSIEKLFNKEPLHDPINPEYLKNTLSIIDIYFEKMEIERITESSDDAFISLFSDIGGQLGLWLGISIVSLMEIIYFLCFSFFGGIYVRWRMKGSFSK